MAIAAPGTFQSFMVLRTYWSKSASAEAAFADAFAAGVTAFVSALLDAACPRSLLFANAPVVRATHTSNFASGEILIVCLREIRGGLYNLGHSAEGVSSDNSIPGGRFVGWTTASLGI